MKDDKTSEEELEVQEVEDQEVKRNVDVKVDVTLFDVNDAEKVLNVKAKEAKEVDGESILKSLQETSQTIHLKGGKEKPKSSVAKESKTTSEKTKTKKKTAKNEER